MPVRRLTDLTWEDTAELADAGAIALLPVGAVEAHGPHLPLATDVIIAEAMARAAANRLAAEPRPIVLLPAISYTPAGFAAGFAGTVTIGADTLRTLVVDIARSLGRHGFHLLAIANAHLDPAHLDALEAAVRQIRDEGLVRVVFPNLVRRDLAARLGDEFRSGACHAGRYEGSIVLAARPDLVRDEIRVSLPPNPASLSDAIREGRGTFEDAGGPRAYFGAPADARAEEGHATITILGTILEEAVRRELADAAAR